MSVFKRNFDVSRHAQLTLMDITMQKAHVTLSRVENHKCSIRI